MHPGGIPGFPAVTSGRGRDGYDSGRDGCDYGYDCVCNPGYEYEAVRTPRVDTVFILKLSGSEPFG